MVDEEKMKLMVPIALFQQKEERKAMDICSFSKNDYVTFHAILAWVDLTIAFLLVSALLIVFFSGQPDDVFAEFKITGLFLFAWGLAYVVTAIVFVLIAVSCYSSRYMDALRVYRQYEQKLLQLQQYYKKAGRKEEKEEFWLKNSEEEKIS